MYNLLLLITSIIGVSLTLFSQAHNLLLLFFGLGLIIASVLTFLIKKQTRTLFFPFIILLGAGLYILNSLDLRANLLNIAFNDPGGYLSSFIAGDQVYPLETAIPDFRFDNDEIFQLRFQKQPLFTGNDFALSDIQTTEHGMDAIWHWVEGEQFKRVTNTDYLHIYDPLFNVYYPNVFMPLLLDARLEFSFINYSPVGPIVTKLNVSDLYYKSQPEYLIFNSPLKQLIIRSDSDETEVGYEVWVNQEMLTWEGTEEGWHYFSFTDQVEKIDYIQIIESSQQKSVTINNLRPTIFALYTVESDPSPIIIDNISLNRYFGRLNRSLPFFKWEPDAILSGFTAINGIMETDDNLLHLKPDGIQMDLRFNQSLQTVTARGLARFAPYILAGNIFITIFLLTAFVLSALFLNSHLESIITKLKKIFHQIYNFFTTQRGDYRLHKLTPFKIFFFFFLIVSWIVFLISSVNSYLLVIAFVLSVILIFYVFMDLEFKK